MTVVELPAPYGRHTLREAVRWPRAAGPPRSRVAFAAPHVVADPRGGGDAVDWPATLAIRRWLWDLGFGVADAMDTAQRGAGLDWPRAAELIRRTGAARPAGARLACGAGTDQLAADRRGDAPDLDAIVAAYREQIDVIERAGAQVIVMSSPQLAAAARGPEDYLAVYRRLLAEVREPVIVHWLGPMFAPALAGYWGSCDLDAATDTLAALVAEHADRIDGVKLSLLDAERERGLRRRLPAGVRMYTGDDFNYPDLIRGGSDALLGVFDAIAPAAAAALQALDAGDLAGYDRALAPTVPLARLLFASPTYHYKTGLVFLCWLTGRQEHFCMLGDQQGARSARHLTEVFVLADRAGLLPDPGLAADRMREFLRGCRDSAEGRLRNEEKDGDR